MEADSCCGDHIYEIQKKRKGWQFVGVECNNLGQCKASIDCYHYASKDVLVLTRHVACMQTPSLVPPTTQVEILAKHVCNATCRHSQKNSKASILFFVNSCPQWAAAMYRNVSRWVGTDEKIPKRNMQVPRLAQLGCLSSAVPNTP